MATFANQKIECFCGPKPLGAPDDLEKVIIDFISGANESLLIAVQEIDSMPIAQAIIDASWKGVRVKMILEQDYLRNKKLPKPETAATVGANITPAALLKLQWQDLGDKTPPINRRILTALLRNGVDAKADYNSKIFHQKFIVRDYTRTSKESPTAAVLTGSTNFTHTGTHENLNNVIVFHDTRACEAYLREFQEIRSGNFGRHTSGDDMSVVFNLEGVPVRILFAPEHSPELEITKHMLKVSETLDFAVFTFSHSSGIDDTMLTLKEAKKTIRGVLDPMQGGQWWAATDYLHDKGIAVRFPDRAKFEPAPFGKLHHKLMVIDQTVVVAGSMNFTKPANIYNDENVVILGSPYPDLPEAKGGPSDVGACKEIGEYFGKEIKRIWGRSTQS